MKEEGITRKKRGGRRMRRKRGGKWRRTEKDEGGGRGKRRMKKRKKQKHNKLELPAMFLHITGEYRKTLREETADQPGEFNVQEEVSILVFF